MKQEPTLFLPFKQACSGIVIVCSYLQVIFNYFKRIQIIPVIVYNLSLTRDRSIIHLGLH